MSDLPIVSIVIVTWNSLKYLPTCLNYLLTQTFHDFEIILVDNGSEDGTLDELYEKYPLLNLSIHRLGSNFGFAVANNIGARLARGKWLALLNADAFPEPDWLNQLVQATKLYPEFNFFASRQIQAHNPELLDGAGDAYHISGLAWRQYYNQASQGNALQTTEVFGACAAAGLYLREAFLATSGFDEDYFSYFEDVDLSFRLRLLGARCLYVPQAIVLHVGSASTGKSSDFAIYHGHRNLVWTYFKDMPGCLFWAFLPLHVAVNLYLTIKFAVVEKRLIIFKSKLDALRGLPNMLRKRKQIQQFRTIHTHTIWHVIIKDLLAPHRASSSRSRPISEHTPK